MDSFDPMSSRAMRDRLAQFRSQVTDNQSSRPLNPVVNEPNTYKGIVPTELYTPVEKKARTQEEIEGEEYMKKVFVPKPIPDRFLTIKSVTIDLRPVKFIFPDAVLKGQAGFNLTYMSEQGACDLGKYVLPMLSAGFTKQGAAAVFQLAYNLRKPMSYYGEYVFGDISEYTSIYDMLYADLGDSQLPGPNRPLEIYDDAGTAKDAASYCYLAASLLRLFTKSAENYVKAFGHICTYFQKFYGESMTLQISKPEVNAIQGLSDWFKIEPRARQTLYRLLILTNKSPECLGFKRFTFEMHLSLTGMHLFSFFVSLAKIINCSFPILFNIIDIPQFSRQVEALLQLFKLVENVDGLHPLRIWKYGRIFDDSFMSDLQTKSCPKLVYIFASALKSEAAETYHNITNIAQLKDVSEETRTRCDQVAKHMINVVKQRMKDIAMGSIRL